jgi:hypothetical protein
MAKPAEINNAFLGDSNGDISFGDRACLADVAYGRNELYPAHGTEDGDFPFGFNLHC